MEIITQYIAYICYAIGSFFVITGAVGMLRMPDYFSRCHPAGVTESAGIPIILIGYIFETGFEITSIKLVLLLIFLILTGPTATHALSKAALMSGKKPVGKDISKESDNG